MKKTAMLVVLALVVALMAPVMAGDMAKKTNTHDVSVWFVSADTKANMLTFKNEKGEEMTVPVLGAAIKEVGALKSGQKIMLTCLDDDKGAHQGISAIKTETAKK